MEDVSYTTQGLDHLGLVAGVCRKIDLIEQIDARVGPTERKVSVGQAVQAMVLNALGFVGRPLYLTPEFFANKPVDLLIGPELRYEDFNDDSLGRALDVLYAVGLTEVYAGVASHAVQGVGIAPRFVHLDTSSFSVEGEYALPSEDPQVVQITYGYSKDGRPDLKQVVLGLICTYRSSIPVWVKALDGNSSDKESFVPIIQAYVEQFSGGETPYIIADSALYSQSNLQEMSSGIRWISRVPATVSEVGVLYEQVGVDQMEVSAQGGYRYLEVGSGYGGVRQRWVVVYSEAAYQREKATLEKQVSREQVQAQKALWHLSGKEFWDLSQVQASLSALEGSWKYHRAKVQVLPVSHYGGRGRPGVDQKPLRVGFRVEGEVEEDGGAIERARRTKGKFVLATNELEQERLPAETILEAYKGQGGSVERGFRFLKDPLFFASGLFLEKPQRIMALLMVMGLSLLVYAVGEHLVRAELARRCQTLPDQRGKPTGRPTMRRIFQVFEGIDVLRIEQKGVLHRRVLNLRPVHRQILELLGPDVQHYYLLEEEQNRKSQRLRCGM